jgi:hypothetical protein
MERTVYKPSWVRLKMFRRGTLIAALSAMLAGGGAAGDSFDHMHKHWTDVLHRFVVNGSVDYAGLKADRSSLDGYLSELAAVTLREFQSWNANQQLAFLINLYNAETVQLIVDHYPVDSIKDIGGFLTKPWDLQCVHLFGKTVTLDTIEHGMIRKNYKEPRIHFVLVCAARGCPPLRSEAYVADRLDAQLDDQVLVFLNTPEKNRIDLENKALYLSPIFKWYGDDFQKYSRSVQYFLSHYYPKEYERALRDGAYEIYYTDYDWSLNDQR